MAWRWKWILLAAVLTAPASCKQQQQAAAPVAPPPPAVGVTPAETKGVAQAYEFVGRIKAVDTVDLRVRVEGFLEKRLFTEGQDVKTGDLLYQIEKAQFQAQVDQAQANVAAAQADLTNAKLQYERALNLVKNQNVSQATVDQRKADVDTATAKVLQTQAALQQAQISLGYTDIRAPIDGLIGRTNYTSGNLVNPSSNPLAVIVSQDPIYAVFPVSQRQLIDIREARRQENGDLAKIEVLVRLANGQEYPHPGVWNFTDPRVDQNTDTVTMRATLPNPERDLLDGQFVNVVVQEKRQQPRLVVPQAALQVDQAGTFVLVVNGEGKVEQRRVALGQVQGADIVVQSGLQEGEKVITDGMQKVRPGQAVQMAVANAGNRG